MAEGEKVSVKLEHDSQEMDDEKPVLLRLSPPGNSANLSSTVDIMSSSFASVAPSNLTRPPFSWTLLEVKAWLEFCVKEYDISPICVDKFNMNGKALLLLTRTDFIERVPHAGDILYNAFQLLQKRNRHFGSDYTRQQILIPPRTSPSTGIQQGSHQAHSAGVGHSAPSFHLQTPFSCASYSFNTSSPTKVLSSEREERLHSATASSVRSSALMTETCSPDADSSQAEHGPSSHANGQEGMDCDYKFDEQDTDTKYGLIAAHDDGACRLLWEFIHQLLQDVKWSDTVCWESHDNFTFRILDPTNLATAWGKQKNRSNMTYEKLSRALRYYYKMNIIRKVSGRRLTYQFLQDPAKIRKGQRGARPHTSRQMESSTPDSSTFPHNSSPKSSPTTARKLSTDSNSTEVSQEQFHPSCESLSSPDSSSNRASISQSISPIHEFTFAAEQQQSHFQEADQRIVSSRSTAFTESNSSPIYQRHEILKQPKYSSFCECDTCSIEGRNITCKCEGYKSDAFTSSSEQGNEGCETRETNLIYYARVGDEPDLSSSSSYRRVDQHQLSSQAYEPFSKASPQAHQPSPQAQQAFLHANQPFPQAHNSKNIPHYQPLRLNRVPEATQTLSHRHQQSPSPFSPSSIPSASSANTDPSNPRSERSPKDAARYIPYPAHHSTPFSRSTSFPEKQHSLPTFLEEMRNPLLMNQQRHVEDPSYNNHRVDKPQACPVKRQEKDEEEQKEPQDLSLKARPNENRIYIKTGPELDLSLGFGIKDMPRDSPLSCSSDSAYSSDRADFGKDSPVEDFHPETQ